MAKKILKYKSVFIHIWLFSLVVFFSCRDTDISNGTAELNPETLIVPKRVDVIAAMRKANDYFLRSELTPGDSHWNKAVYYSAELDLFELTRDSTYLAHSFSWAKRNKFSLVLDRGENLSEIRNADKQCCGQAYFKLSQFYQNNSMIDNIIICMENMLLDNRDNYWTWIDALYMAMPVLIETGNFKNDARYYKKTYELFTFTKDKIGLYSSNGLWYRDADYLPEHNITIRGKAIHWSRGNGWVYAALAKTLAKLPPTAIGRSEYLAVYKKMSKAIVNQQRKDGFWNRNLVDPLDYPGPETSGTALFAFGLAWGINNDVLTEREYWESVSCAWQALSEVSLSQTGFLGYVQPQGASPKFGGLDISANTEDFGVGVFLSAGFEISKLEITLEKIKSKYYENSI
ncbi:MAG: glycoside hydrolase family 88 protein [Mangrovibacterium sp.]